MNKNRRSLIKLGLFSMSIGGMPLKTFSAEALQEMDPQAVALGYKSNVSKIDVLRWTSYKAGNSCSNCSYYQHSNGLEGPCKVFGGKIVASQGWCNAYKKS